MRATNNSVSWIPSWLICAKMETCTCSWWIFVHRLSILTVIVSLLTSTRRRWDTPEQLPYWLRPIFGLCVSCYGCALPGLRFAPYYCAVTGLERGALALCAHAKMQI